MKRASAGDGPPSPPARSEASTGAAVRIRDATTPADFDLVVFDRGSRNLAPATAL